MDCNEVLEQLSEYLDREARDELCKALEEHLHRCTDCKIYVDTVKKTIMLYQADRAIEAPPAIASQLEAALAREYRSPIEDRSSN